MKRLLAPIAAAFWLCLFPALATHAQGPDIGGDFELRTVTGEPFGSENLKDRPYALFFGFTNCPEVCPMALAELSFSLQSLGEDGDRFTPVFVTVDPERDTPERLEKYLGAFDERIVGLWGTEEEIAAVARAFRATYRRVPLSGSDYTVDHTAIIYLMNGDGTFFDKIDYREDYELQLEKYRWLIDAHRRDSGN